MSTPTKNSNADLIASDSQLASGILKHKAGLPPTMTLVGQTYTPDSAVAVLQARITAASAVAPAKATYASVVLANHTEREATDEFVSDLKAFLLIANKTQPQVLADCGLTLPKKTERTPAMKVVAAAKAQVTRTLRATKSPKAKAAIKGALSGPVVVTDKPAPQTVPAAPPPTAAAGEPAATAALAVVPHAVVAAVKPPEGTSR